MAQSRGSLRFSLKTGKSLGILGEVIRQELQSHKPTQGYVFRFVDDAHTAAAELFDDSVVRDGLVDHGASSWYVSILGKSIESEWSIGQLAKNPDDHRGKGF
jgi:hypothetical protein